MQRAAQWWHSKCCSRPLSICSCTHSVPLPLHLGGRCLDWMEWGGVVLFRPRREGVPLNARSDTRRWWTKQENTFLVNQPEAQPEGVICLSLWLSNRSSPCKLQIKCSAHAIWTRNYMIAGHQNYRCCSPHIYFLPPTFSIVHNVHKSTVFFESKKNFSAISRKLTKRFFCMFSQKQICWVFDRLKSLYCFRRQYVFWNNIFWSWKL